jgi:hypothetical protein
LPHAAAMSPRLSTTAVMARLFDRCRTRTISPYSYDSCVVSVAFEM